MEVVNEAPKKRKTNKTGIHQVISYNDPAYERKLSMYQMPPTEEVTMDEFEDFAFSRMKVLKEIEHARVKGLRGLDYSNKIESVVREHGLYLVNYEDYRKDVVSHYILRLAFCRPNDRKWFVKHEAQLLKYRLVPEKINGFLSNNQISYVPLSPDELRSNAADLKTLHPNFRKDKYYKVPFEEALDLVKHRKVLLKRGNAYVPEDELSTIILARYKESLRQALENTYKVWAHKMHEFESIRPIVDSISKQYLGTEYKVDNKAVHGKIELGQIDMLSKRSFPMCMKHTYSKLRQDHHLKHWGRMQFGLFLKGIGLTLQDALIFWRMEFTQKMSSDKFERAYSYNIRHSYGKEGRRADYTPYSCMKMIIDTNLNLHYGCPFKNYDADVMKTSLKSQGVSNIGVNEIIELVKGQHFQIACQRHFELTHPNCKNDLVINHPNQYFDESERYFGSKLNKENNNNASATSENAPTTAPVNEDIPNTN